MINITRFFNFEGFPKSIKSEGYSYRRWIILRAFLIRVTRHSGLLLVNRPLGTVGDGVEAVEDLTIAGLDLPLLDMFQTVGEPEKEDENPEPNHPLSDWRSLLASTLRGRQTLLKCKSWIRLASVRLSDVQNWICRGLSNSQMTVPVMNKVQPKTL